MHDVPVILAVAKVSESTTTHLQDGNEQEVSLYEKKGKKIYQRCTFITSCIHRGQDQYL